SEPGGVGHGGERFVAALQAGLRRGRGDGRNRLTRLTRSDTANGQDF
ncbi:MAG: hypothetical protein V7645_2707, partial [Actinomycetota bacterium]